MSNSLMPWMQHSCPSASPRACSNSCPLNRWCHPTISPSVIPFSSCFQSFPASESFLMSQLFPSISHKICYIFIFVCQRVFSNLLLIFYLIQPCCWVCCLISTYCEFPIFLLLSISKLILLCSEKNTQCDFILKFVKICFVT